MRGNIVENVQRNIYLIKSRLKQHEFLHSNRQYLEKVIKLESDK